jgi:multidrug efflux system membrane fusion protein
MDDRVSDSISPVSRTAPPWTKPPRRRVGARIAWLLVLLLIAGAVAWVVLRPHAAPPSQGGRFSGSGPLPVGVAAAVKGDVPVTLNGLGTVTPLATVTVRTQIGGQLMQIAFTEGQEVNKGDFLAQVDPRPYQLALDQANGQLLKDQALLKDAEIDLARFQKLAAQDSIAKQQVDTQQYLVHQYEGTVKTDQAQVDNAKLNLAYCHIIAPVAGRVGLRQVDQGNYVQTSDANGIVVIAQLKPISVIFTLPEDSLPAILTRLHAGATLPVVAFDRTRTTQLASGTLLTIDNQIDPTTGTVKLRAQFDNADESLFPNQFVNAQLLVDTLQGTTVIPTAAIQRGAPGTFVYLVKADNTVTVQPVKLGPAAGEKIAVLSGLAPGDQVVVDGADKLRDGAKVTLPAAAGSTAPQKQAAQPADAGQPGAEQAGANQPATAEPPAPTDQPAASGQAKDGKKRRRSTP